MNKRMFINSEIFQICNENMIFLYAPLLKKLLKISLKQNNLLFDISKNIKISPNQYYKNRNFIEFMLKNQILSEKPFQSEKWKIKSDFGPTRITFFPTNQCNLNCVYCYASAGEKNKRELDIETAKIGIDEVSKNISKTKTDKLRISYHGGGEVFMSFGFIKESIEYAQKKAKEIGVELKVTVVTNGCLNAEMVDFITKKMSYVTLSLDGPPFIQNKQRPTRSGKTSFDCVIQTAKHLRRSGTPFGFRATATKEVTEMMPEVVGFFGNLGLSNRLHIETLHFSGRCKETGIEVPKPEVFVQKYISAKKKALQLGIDLKYTGDIIGKPGKYFCGALDKNFAITTDGFVSACFEVTSIDDPKASSFIYGKIDKKNNRIVIYKDRIIKLRERMSSNIKWCKDCFLKFDCRGGCPARTSNLFIPEKNKCYINQQINIQNIINLYKEGNHEYILPIDQNQCS